MNQRRPLLPLAGDRPPASGASAASVESAVIRNQQQQQRRRRRTRKSNSNLFLEQILVLAVFLVAWVANGELLQAITNGSVGPHPYNKPFFVTWFSYNFTSLGLLGVRWHCQRKQVSLVQYIQHEWAGKLGVWKCLLGCASIAYLLQILNILMILGLDCISVSLSNGIYQIQTAFTLLLSVVLLKDRFVCAEAVGLMTSTVGVAILVVPPICVDDTSLETQSCHWRETRTQSIVAGIVYTVASAALGGSYLVSWRVFDEWRGIASDSPGSDPWEGLVDTQMTLAAIGLCNIFLGWPLISMAHVLGWEVWEFPGLAHVGWLLGNGLVEYIFDASCAVAIYKTSPIIVAVTSPLTAPLSNMVDHFLYPMSPAAGSSVVTPRRIRWWLRHSPWLGTAVTMMGVYLLQSKPSLVTKCGSECAKRLCRMMCRRTKQNKV